MVNSVSSTCAVNNAPNCSALSLQQLMAELIECAANTANSLQKKQNLPMISQICFELASEILNGTYQPGVYTRFAVTEPKLREIYAPAFRDRLVQCFIVKYAEPLVERHLIEDTFANRKNKGTFKAVLRAQQFMRKPNHRYYLQLDIQAFFNSIHRPTLNQLWQNYLAKFNLPYQTLLAELSQKVILQSVADYPCVLSGSKALLKKIPKHKQLGYAKPETGLPIGSVTSQLFANFYLSFLDHFVKHELKVKGYCRYMDDLVLFADSTAQLINWQKQIQVFLKQTLRLNLHPTKQHIQLTRQGIIYLGFNIYANRCYVKKYNIRKFKNYLAFFNCLLLPHNGENIWLPDKHYWQKAYTEFRHYYWEHQITYPQVTFVYPYLKQMESVINSYLDLLAHAQHFQLRKQIICNDFHQLSHYFIMQDCRYSSIRVKKWVAKAIS